MAFNIFGIGSTVVNQFYQWLGLAEQGSTPSNPDAGRHKLFVNGSGQLCTVDHSGTVTTVGSGDAGSVAWSDVTDKPTTFTPATHTHSGGDVTTAVANANAAPWSGVTGKTSATYFDPALPPSTPNSRNDEFAGSSLDAKWTVFNPNADFTQTVSDGLLKMRIASGPSAGIRGIFQTLPASGDWTAICKTWGGPPSTLDDASRWTGLGLFQSAASSWNSSDIAIAMNATNKSGKQLAVMNFTSYSTWGSDLRGLFSLYGSGAVWLKIVKASTVYTFWVSTDGRDYLQLYSGALGFTPAEIGLVMSRNSGDYTGYFEFFRFFESTDSGVLGGQRTLTTPS